MLQLSKWRTISTADGSKGSRSRCRRDRLDDAGQAGAVPASLLEQDQGAEPGGDEVLDTGDLVAGGLVSDAEPLGDLPASQLLHDPQLVDLLLAGSQGGDDRLHQPCGVGPAHGAARAGLVVVFGFL